MANVVLNDYLAKLLAVMMLDMCGSDFYRSRKQLGVASGIDSAALAEEIKFATDSSESPDNSAPAPGSG